jgi:hypothetical protein
LYLLCHCVGHNRSDLLLAGNKLFLRHSVACQRADDRSIRQRVA